jgi:hypothetical protein
VGIKRPEITDQEFIAVYRKLQSAYAVMRHFGISHAAVWSRRKRIEKTHGVILPQNDKRKKYARGEVNYGNAIYQLEIENGCVLIGSDVHVWPGMRTTVQRAFIRFAKKLKPVAVILNGDVFDGASISRHPPIGWEGRPTVKQELDAVKDFLGDLVIAAGDAQRIWTCGNHDSRYATRIAQMAPEYAGVQGTQLKDHFEQWVPAWRCDINDDVVVKHRIAGGEHADHNNVVKSGKTTVTGHDHRLNVTPYRDYRGTRYGVRCGYMGDSPLDPQFINYMEAHEPNWEAGFVVLSFSDARLLMPEMVAQWQHGENTVQFRGELIEV